MPAPLIWLGIGLASLYATDTLSKRYQKEKGRVVVYPGESDLEVQPVNGSVVCCGIFSIFDHTGIWCDGNIIELKGNGLIRGISPERFLQGRSGNRIYVACNASHEPMIDVQSMYRAVSRVYEYSPYHLIENNCHRFVWQCLSGRRDKITRFSELNDNMSRHFGEPVHWHKAKI